MMGEICQTVTFTTMTEKKCSFAESLAAVREVKGYTQDKAAGIVSKSRRSFIRWEKGETEPDEMTQKAILRTLKGARVRPSQAEITKARKHHHVAWEKGRGWFMRITLLVDKKRVGKRVKFRLRTKELNEAIKRRDTAISAYKAMGFQLTSRGSLVFEPKGTTPDNRQINQPTR